VAVVVAAAVVVVVVVVVVVACWVQTDTLLQDATHIVMSHQSKALKHSHAYRLLIGPHLTQLIAPVHVAMVTTQHTGDMHNVRETLPPPLRPK